MVRSIDEISDEEALAAMRKDGMKGWLCVCGYQDAGMRAQRLAFSLHAEKTYIRMQELRCEKRARLDRLYPELDLNQSIIDGDSNLQLLDNCYTQNIHQIASCKQKASKYSRFKPLSDLYDLTVALIEEENVAIYETFESSEAVPSYVITQEIQKLENELNNSLSCDPRKVFHPSGLYSSFNEDRNHYAGTLSKKPSGTSLA